MRGFSIYGWEVVVPRCECVCARDVGGLHLPGSLPPQQQGGWVREDSCVGGVDGSVRAEGLGQELERDEEGVVITPVAPPTLPEAAPDWLRDSRAQVTFASRAERGRADPRSLAAEGSARVRGRRSAPESPTRHHKDLLPPCSSSAQPRTSNTSMDCCTVS